MVLGIKPTVDIVFKKILGSEDHSNLTLSFLNSVLPLAGRPKAARVDILNSWKDADFKGGKDIIVDIRAKDESGRDFQIEMQVKADAAPFDRMLDNWARIFSGQIGKGENYEGHRPAISIWILGHSLFSGEAWFHAIEAHDSATHSRISESLLILAIELEKRARLPDFDERTIIKPGLDEWLYLLSRGDTLDPDSPILRKASREIKEALEIMSVFTRSERAKYAYQKRMDFLWSERGRLEWAERRAKERGLEEGRAEGRAEGKAEGRAEGQEEGARQKALAIARSMKAEGLGIELICRVSGLSASEIQGF